MNRPKIFVLTNEAGSHVYGIAGTLLPVETVDENPELVWRTSSYRDVVIQRLRTTRLPQFCGDGKRLRIVEIGERRPCPVSFKKCVEP